MLQKDTENTWMEHVRNEDVLKEIGIKRKNQEKKIVFSEMHI